MAVVLGAFALYTLRYPEHWYGKKKEHAHVKQLGEELNSLSDQLKGLRRSSVAVAWASFVETLSKMGLAKCLPSSNLIDLTKEVKEQESKLAKYEKQFKWTCVKRAPLFWGSVYAVGLAWEKLAVPAILKWCQEVFIKDLERRQGCSLFRKEDQGDLCRILTECQAREVLCKKPLAKAEAPDVEQQEEPVAYFANVMQTTEKVVDLKNRLKGPHLSMCPILEHKDAAPGFPLFDPNPPKCYFSQQEGYEAWMAPWRTATGQTCKELIEATKNAADVNKFVKDYCPV